MLLLISPCQTLCAGLTALSLDSGGALPATTPAALARLRRLQALSCSTQLVSQPLMESITRLQELTRWVQAAGRRLVVLAGGGCSARGMQHLLRAHPCSTHIRAA